nr:alpha/beta fold hydrolase [Pseudomonas congelans]
MWGGQIVGLAAHYQVIAYDMLGHGASPRPDPDTGLPGYAEQLHELLTHLQLPQAAGAAVSRWAAWWRVHSRWSSPSSYRGW